MNTGAKNVILFFCFVLQPVDAGIYYSIFRANQLAFIGILALDMIPT